MSELRVLIVDDDQSKWVRVRDCVTAVPLAGGVDVKRATDVTEALAAVEEIRPDLLILDLALPVESGEEPDPMGGRLVLTRLQARSGFVPPHVVALTAFDEVESANRETIAQLGWLITKYDPKEAGWVQTVQHQLLHIAASREHGYRFDVAFVCALEKPELRQVLSLPLDWSRRRLESDPTTYHLASIADSGGRERRVMACSVGRMGMSAAAAVATKIILRYRPRVLIMTGIAGGLAGQLGDVLVSTSAWDYGSGKRLPDGGFQAAPDQLPADETLVNCARELQADPEVRAKLLFGWAQDPVGLPSIQIGPIGCGAAVVQYEEIKEDLVEAHRKTVGLDMESYGVLMAAQLAPNPRPACIVVKGISDLADAVKDDSAHSFAAHTSARFAVELLNRFWG